MAEEIIGGSSATLTIGSLSSYVARMNKFLYKADFVTEEKLTTDIQRVAAEAGLSSESIVKVMESTLTIMEERRAEAGVDNDKIGEGYAYGVRAVYRPGLMRPAGFFQRGRRR